MAPIDLLVMLAAALGCAAAGVIVLHLVSKIRFRGPG
jgi:hypothetical protein